jgi:hypothetical protein
MTPGSEQEGNCDRRRRGAIVPSICAAAFFVLSGCEKIVYWEHLPQPSASRVVSTKGDSESITRAVAITKKLVDVKPLPAAVVFIMTNEYRFKTQKLPAIPDRAHTSRCLVKGEEKHETRPPSSACIWLPGSSVDRMSDEALAAVIAHELGHIEKGHKGSHGVAEPQLSQWEADEAATERLRLAGYCPGQAMRKYAAELTASSGGRLRHPWRNVPLDC